MGTDYLCYSNRIPNRDTISSLIYKRGHIRKDDKVVGISSNQLVEDLLGSEGLICIEDLVHSLHLGDKHLDKVLTTLWYRICWIIVNSPFKLSKPKEGVLKGGRKAFDKGGDWGNRGEQINKLIAAMI